MTLITIKNPEKIDIKKFLTMGEVRIRIEFDEAVVNLSEEAYLKFVARLRAFHEEGE